LTNGMLFINSEADDPFCVLMHLWAWFPWIWHNGSYIIIKVKTSKLC